MPRHPALPARSRTNASEEREQVVERVAGGHDPAFGVDGEGVPKSPKP
jgi:hypothetical protein